MSKKYRLKEEYPGSHPVGTISKLDYSKYPKLWEEIVEKDYEILSFRYRNGDIVTLREKGVYIVDSASDMDYPGCSLEEQLESTSCEIYSIKRLSDGEVFSVGDRAETRGEYPHTISGIEIRQKSIKGGREKDGIDRIWLNWEENSGGNWLETSDKVNDYIFTTDDGVEIYEGDTYYLVSHSFIVSHCSYHSPTDLTYTLFSTKEVADEYVKMNKPEFSRNQILELLEKLKK